MPYTRMTLLTSLVFVLLCFGSATAVQADVITINAVDSGRYFNTGQHFSTDKSYVVGTPFRNYFVFDLSGVVPGTISSATLRLFNPSGGYQGVDPIDTYTLFDVVTSIPALTASYNIGGMVGAGIFFDLGSGSVYGSRLVSAADNNTVISFSLNATALANLNNASGLFAVGGRLSESGSAAGNQLFFGTTSVPAPGTRQLVLEATPVPEPATLVLLGTGLAGIGALVRKRRRATSSKT